MKTDYFSQKGLPIQLLNNTLSCPHCDAQNVNSNGTSTTNHQYHCLQCGKYFSATNGTAIHGIKKRKLFLEYAHCIAEGLSIRASAKRLGISVSTSFAWRHKHLVAHRDRNVADIQKNISLSVQSTPYSEKGKRHKLCKTKELVHTVMQVYPRGEIFLKKLDKKSDIRHYLNQLIDKKAQINYKNNPVLSRRINCAGLMRIKNTHLNHHLEQQRANRINDLTNWMSFFRGVATKYLQNYWNWYCSYRGDWAVDQIQSSALLHTHSQQQYLYIKSL